ncbi:hypothetical protein [Candidatus Chlamydia corallus]|uniref:hypothetical protein n=1 Tax=Candidatus Chlamydia corallus TaxID=2038470 RepID=UPI000C2FE406|nr:hypothetical protein [Candidatus Chlamydia corallus]
MACSLYFVTHSNGARIPKAYLIADALLYPVISVICAVAFAILMLVKLIVLSIKFLVLKCVAACRSKEGPSFKDGFGGLHREGVDKDPIKSDFFGCLLIIPIIGTLIHSTICSWKLKRWECFCLAPVLQIPVTALSWSYEE